MYNTNVDDQKFLVIDFETVTPKGFPPEPIQLGLMHIDGLTINNNNQQLFHIKPPKHAPLTIFDTNQTGITWDNLSNADVAEDIFYRLDDICSKHNYILIAQNAKYEYNIVKRFSNDKPNLQNILFIDTIKLSKYVFPELNNYKLDTIAGLLDVNIPVTRHNALTDCIITGEIFSKLVKILNITKTSKLLNIASINYTEMIQLKLDL